LFGLGVEFGVIKAVGGDDGIDDTGEFVRGGDECGRPAERGAHAAAEVIEFILDVIQARRNARAARLVLGLACEESERSISGSKSPVGSSPKILTTMVSLNRRRVPMAGRMCPSGPVSEIVNAVARHRTPRFSRFTLNICHAQSMRARGSQEMPMIGQLIFFVASENETTPPFEKVTAAQCNNVQANVRNHYGKTRRRSIKFPG
jgi:hypothetical protein